MLYWMSATVQPPKKPPSWFIQCKIGLRRSFTENLISISTGFQLNEGVREHFWKPFYPFKEVILFVRDPYQRMNKQLFYHFPDRLLESINKILY